MKKLVLAMLALCGVMAAQDKPAVVPSPNLAGIAHVALRVKDLQASVAFYEKLGFVKAFELSKDGRVYEAFIKINDRQFIELYPVDAKNPQAGFLHLCFEGKDLNAVHDYYVAQGLKPIAVRTAGAGNLLFTMPGPDTPQGPQNMEYTQYMPGSLHSKDFGQHLGKERAGDDLTQVYLAVNDPAQANLFYTSKAGFRPAGSSVIIPGSISRLELVPAATLGQRAHLDLHLNGVPEQVGARLRSQGIDVKEHGAVLSVEDPDANILDFWSAPVVVVKPR